MNSQIKNPTNTLAILSLVFAFVFSPVGLVLGIVALNQISKSGENGRGLALASVILSILIILLPLILIFVTVSMTGIR